MVGYVLTPWGRVGVVVSERGLEEVSLPALATSGAAEPGKEQASPMPAEPVYRDAVPADPVRPDPVRRRLQRWQELVHAYAWEPEKVRDGFPWEDLAWERVGEFTAAVCRAMTEIPWGETRTYGELARRVGRPRGARAVGQACGRNPWPLVVPCHRVVATDGLGGYGGGLALKEALLAWERRLP